MIIKYSPSLSVLAPRSVPRMITLAPIRGSEVSEEVICPLIFPVFPAKRNPDKVKRISRYLKLCHTLESEYKSVVQVHKIKMVQ